MSKENQELSYDELVHELAQLCKIESTGTMFIVTDSRHSARIGIQEGQIICFSYRMKKGFDALHQLYEVESGKYHFSQGIFNPYNKLDLPDSSVLLQHFRLKTFPDVFDSATPEKVDLSKTVKIDIDSNIVAVAAASVQNTEFSIPSTKIVQIIGDIENILLNYLGPFADISIHDYLAGHRRPETEKDFKNMIDFLKLEIDEVSDQHEFETKCTQILLH